MPLALPFEVIERVIDHYSDSVATLYSFTLTCRDLNPRSTIVLLRRVSFKNRKQIFSFCDVLAAKPHLRHAVRVIAVPVTEFSPHPLLRLLNNLTEIEFKPPAASPKSSSQSRSSRRSVIHPSVSTYCRVSANHIQSLALRRLTLYSFSALSGLLLSFPKIKTLFCLHFKVEKDSEDWEPVGRILSQRMQLETLTVQVDDNSISLRPLELLGEAAKHTVQWLRLNLDFIVPVDRSVDNLVGVLPSPSWVHLTTLVIRFPLQVIEQIAGIVSHIDRPPKLKKIVIEFRIATLKDMVQFLHSEPSLIKRPELETALLQFSQPHIRFSLIPSLNDRSEDFWRDHLTEYFPALRTRNGASLKAKHSLEKFGHDSRITTAIAISADSRWAATGSDDDTIIIWDLSDGSISQEWFVQTPTNGTAAGVAGGLADPHPRRHLTSLCFSPDSLYLMSTGLAPGVTVWNICRSDTPYKVASLGDDNGVVQRFMWSPDGDSILAKFSNLNGIMCKWEASTLRQLGAHRTGHGVLQVLSPNGRWLLQVTGVSRV
uniref:MFS domain-containing protein n=1 Tax=Ganoderma boninense TaxID=34458 RepID=A0A5K1JZB4_9APHY|nr:MFS domain-containing protein [Ganoderma boninense]